MAPFQQPPAAHNWDRWQQHHPTSDYMMMDGMVTYDARSLPPTTSLQRPVMASQYVVGNSYSHNPATPMSASAYGSQGQFAEYGSYNHPSPPLASQFHQVHERMPQRPMAPPTPPLDEDRLKMQSRDSRALYAPRDASRDSSRESVSTVKSETSSTTLLESKTVPKFVKADGTLQNEFNSPVDLVLRKLDEVKLKDVPKSTGSSPAESCPSPAEEENQECEQPPGKPKKFVCPIRECGRSFAQNAQLVTHKRSHTGDKPYACTWPGCHKRVSQPGNLATHMRTHTGEKPYQCPICGQAFGSRGNIKPHIAAKHEGSRKFMCRFGECNKPFTTKGNMKNHINKFHVDEIRELLSKLDRLELGEDLDERERELLSDYAHTFKNSNKGIKGRGPSDKKEHFRRTSMKRQVTQQMTPVSPEPSHGASSGYRAQYYEQPQPAYHGPLQPPQPQHHGHYSQVPVHHDQHPHYHGLPLPAAYNMAWGPGPQYH